MGENSPIAIVGGRVQDMRIEILVQTLNSFSIGLLSTVGNSELDTTFTNVNEPPTSMFSGLEIRPGKRIKPVPAVRDLCDG